MGRRFLLLTHIGRKTGLRRQTVLEIIAYRPCGPTAVVMSGFGYRSDWLLNIDAKGTEEIQVGSQHFRTTHRVLRKDEAVDVLRAYEIRNWMIDPIIRRVLSWLAGWRYRGTEVDRARLVGQLPLIEFSALEP